MKRIRALIVEDEPPSRAALRRMLAREKDVVLLQDCADGHTALQGIREQRPDLVFLDVMLPGMNGFEVLDALAAATPPAVIFVTASDRHALRAFASHAVDYLLKPFTTDRLREALNRARFRLHGPSDTLVPKLASLARSVRQGRAPQRLSLKVGRGFVLIETDEIESAVADQGGTLLHTPTHVHRSETGLSVLQKKLPPENFVRINRSTLVNARQVKEVVRKTHGDGLVRLHSGREFKLARRYRMHWMTLVQATGETPGA